MAERVTACGTGSDTHKADTIAQTGIKTPIHIYIIWTGATRFAYARFAYALFSKTCPLLFRHRVSRVVSPTHWYSFRLRAHVGFAESESGLAFCTDCTTEHTTNIGLISDKNIEIETESAFSLLNSEAVGDHRWDCTHQGNMELIPENILTCVVTINKLNQNAFGCV